MKIKLKLLKYLKTEEDKLFNRNLFIKIIQLQLSDEKARVGILQRHEVEHKKDIERLQEKATKYEEEATHAQYSIETISRELKEKVLI